VYDDGLVDKILGGQEKLHKTLKMSSRNVMRYPTFLKSIVKLVFAWNAAGMIYFGILMGSLPGGVLINNLYLGAASFVVGPLTNILMSSKYAFRRPILAVQYAAVGIGCLSSYVWSKFWYPKV